MKAIVCEMCNSNDLVKQDGNFVCQCCGTKYSAEEAKKMMVEGVVNIVGTVSIDNSASYEHILQLARDAFSDKRFDSAYDYYCKAVEIKQDVVENVLRQGLSILGKESFNSDIPSSCINRVCRAVDLIKQNFSEGEKNNMINSAVDDIKTVCGCLLDSFDEEIRMLIHQKKDTRSLADVVGDLSRPTFIASMNQAEDKKIEQHNKEISDKISVIKSRRAKVYDFQENYSKMFANCADVNSQFCFYYKEGDFSKIVELYPQITLTKDDKIKLIQERNYMGAAARSGNVELVKVLIDMGCDINKPCEFSSPLFWVTAYKPTNEKVRQGYIEITKLLIENGAIINADEKDGGRTLVNSDTDEEIKRILIAKVPGIQNKITKAPESGGCYVATAVYGSYDCPQVWTLRRFRDYTLAETWYGRAFIHTYYAISPTIVKWFGKTEWFKKMWRGKLDKMVSRLNEKGVGNAPYEDKKW